MADPLRPGMLALVKGLQHDVEHNGKCVEIYSVVSPGETFRLPHLQRQWFCNNTKNPGWICLHPSFSEGWGPFERKNLIPLEDPDGDFEDGKEVYRGTLRVRSKETNQ